MVDDKPPRHTAIERRKSVRGAAMCVAALALLGGAIMTACYPNNETHASTNPNWSGMRESMVRNQIETRGVKDPAVLEAMRTVPRHDFVPTDFREQAYHDSPLPIGESQTISQPYIVALMTELLEVEKGDKVLEIGTGSGYQAAVLAAMGVHVYSIEIVPRLCKRAAETLKGAGYTTVEVRCGDGYRGWPEHAPFDGIIVTAAPERIPEPLLDQLREGAPMVIPVGAFYQELMVVTKKGDKVKKRNVIPVRFVPMTGEIEKPR